MYLYIGTERGHSTFRYQAQTIWPWLTVSHANKKGSSGILSSTNNKYISVTMSLADSNRTALTHNASCQHQ